CLGGLHVGGGHIGGLRGAGLQHQGGLHTGGLSPGGPQHTGGLSRQALHTGNQTLQGGRSVAKMHGPSRTHGRLATRVGARFSQRAFFGHDGFGHFRRFAVFGWVGPLFWPYAYSDIYCDIFWGYWGYGCADPYWRYTYYGDPFWDYGYADIYGGLFSPFAFNDLTRDLPSTHPRRSHGTTPSTALAPMCGDDTKEGAGWPVDRIQPQVTPDD